MGYRLQIDCSAVAKLDETDTDSLFCCVGALNPERLALLLERFNELESFGFAKDEKFLYGSHYSSPGMVVHFNLRQEPFTTMAVSLQGGRFDCPDRLFFDLSESWRSCNTSTSDVKELIPGEILQIQQNVGSFVISLMIVSTCHLFLQSSLQCRKFF